MCNCKRRRRNKLGYKDECGCKNCHNNYEKCYGMRCCNYKTCDQSVVYAQIQLCDSFKIWDATWWRYNPKCCRFN